MLDVFSKRMIYQDVYGFSSCAGPRVLIVTHRSEVASQLCRALLELGAKVSTADRIPDARAQPFDIVVLEVRGSPSADLDALHAVAPSARVLMVAPPDEKLLGGDFPPHIYGWIMPWESVVSTLASTVAVASGCAVISLPILQLLLHGRPVGEATGLDVTIERGLTPRQRDVLKLAARGLSDREIANALSLSTRTVNRHISDVLHRLKCATRRQAVDLVFPSATPAVPPLASHESSTEQLCRPPGASR